MASLVRNIQLSEELKHPSSIIYYNMAQLYKRFIDKLYNVVDNLDPVLSNLPVKYMVVFGSFAKGHLTAWSDIDLLVILHDDYKKYGKSIIAIRWAIEDVIGIEGGEYQKTSETDIPIDLEIDTYSGIYDLTRDEKFKRDMFAHNMIVWESDNDDG